MDIDRIVSELREKAEGPLRPSPMATPDDLTRWGVDNENLDDMLDAVSLRVARRYAARELTFEIASAMANDLYVVPLIYADRTGDYWPELFWEIYLAFDSGNFIALAIKAMIPSQIIPTPLYGPCFRECRPR